MNNGATTSRSAMWAMLVCYGSMTCLAISANLPPVYLTTFRDVFSGLTEEQLGRIPAVIFGATVVGILVSGPLADRWGAKLFAMLGLVLSSVGLCMLAGAANYGMLLGAGAIMGLGGGILDMVLSPIVCAIQPYQRARALNWLHAFYCIGALGTVLAASAALRIHVSWRILALAMNLVPVSMFIGFMFLRIPPLVHEEATRTPVRTLLNRPFFWGALVAILLCGATEQGMSQWLPAYADTVLGYGKASSGLALAGFSICMTLGRATAGGVAHRISVVPMMILACVACVACYAVGCFLPSASIALAACVVMGFPVACLWPSMLSLTAERDPHGGASMFSLMAAAGNAGCFAMPWLIGVVAQGASLRWGLASAMVCPIILGVILLGIASRRPVQPA